MDGILTPQLLIELGYSCGTVQDSHLVPHPLSKMYCVRRDAFLVYVFPFPCVKWITLA